MRAIALSLLLATSASIAAPPPMKRTKRQVVKPTTRNRNIRPSTNHTPSHFERQAFERIHQNRTIRMHLGKLDTPAMRKAILMTGSDMDLASYRTKDFRWYWLKMTPPGLESHTDRGDGEATSMTRVPTRKGIAGINLKPRNGLTTEKIDAAVEHYFKITQPD